MTINNKIIAYSNMRQNKGIGNQKLLIFVVLLIVVGFLIGIISVNIKTDKLDKSKDQISQQQDFQAGLSASPTLKPTFKPLAETVKSITNDQIVLNNPQGGDMIVPKNPQMVKVYQRAGEGLQEITFDKVQIGQRVTLKILVPGKSAELIIEE